MPEENKNTKILQLFRFLVSGGFSAAIHFSILYFLTESVGLWYLFSTMIAFSVASIVNFILQKFWVFADKSNYKTAFQFSAHITLGLINLSLNTGLVFWFVEKFGLWYLLAQFIVATIIAIETFVAFKYFIFKRND